MVVVWEVGEDEQRQRERERERKMECRQSM
jgi:hypothetical protein